MRIGVMVGEGSGTAADFGKLVAQAKRAEALGLDTAWIANIAIEAICASAAVGRETERIEIGTAVVPTHPRHPFAMAQEAMTAQAACDGRFALGIGLSHKMVIEGMLGLSYEKPARHMREYLEVLNPLLRGEDPKHRGELYSMRMGPMSLGFAEPPPVLLAALGPVMLRIAGSASAGTITWATGLRTLEGHIVPKLRAAAEDAGRPAPRVVAGFPVALVKDAERAREVAGRAFAIYREIPSYRAMLDREGAGGVEDLALVGDEAELEKGLARLRDAGVTDFCGFLFEAEAGSASRSLDALGGLRSA